ncbi:hypothetical protein [Dactylosporangium sp. NPDC051541]|uniref:hypothetical protein n=1 Tax=Dactylosporangium sp. NPDC051541 TaxID=3363977 RepID=UPI0037B4BFD0
MLDLTAPAEAIRRLAGASRAEAARAAAELTAGPGFTPNGLQLLVRAAARARLHELGGDGTELRAALADLDGSAVAGPVRDAVARHLVLAQLRAARRGHPADPARLRDLLDLPDLPDDPEAPGTLDTLRGLALAAETLARPGTGPRAALEALDRLAAPPELGPLVAEYRAALLAVPAPDLDAQADADRVAAEVRARREVPPPSSNWLRSELIRLGQEAMAAAQRFDVPTALSILRRAEPIAEQLPLDDPAANRLRALLEQLKNLDMTVPEIPDGFGIAPAERAFLEGMAECAQAGERKDGALLERGTGRIRAALGLATADDPKRITYLASLGQMETQLFRLGRASGRLPEAIGHLEDAAALAGGATHPLWSMVSHELAVAYRLDTRTPGRAAAARRWGRHALDGHVAVVREHERPDDARSAARHAMTEATEIARWSLADGDAAAAAAALEIGLGLLADPALEPPGLDEVRAALTRLGADALAYLVPADEHGPDVAVLVPRAEHPYHIPLSELAGPRVVRIPTDDPSARRLCDRAWHGPS